MKGLNLYLFAFFLLLGINNVNAQKKLSIIGQGPGIKTCELYENDVLRFKTRQSNRWTSKKIVNLHDSVIIFEDESQIKWSQLKKIRIDKKNFLVSGFQKFFFAGGLIFFPLNTINQLIVDDRPIFSPLAAGISGGLLVTSFALKQLNITRIKLGNRSFFRLTEQKFNSAGQGR